MPSIEINTTFTGDVERLTYNTEPHGDEIRVEIESATIEVNKSLDFDLDEISFTPSDKDYLMEEWASDDPMAYLTNIDSTHMIAVLEEHGEMPKQKGLVELIEQQFKKAGFESTLKVIHACIADEMERLKDVNYKAGHDAGTAAHHDPHTAIPSSSNGADEMSEPGIERDSASSVDYRD